MGTGGSFLVAERAFVFAGRAGRGANGAGGSAGGAGGFGTDRLQSQPVGGTGVGRGLGFGTDRLQSQPVGGTGGGEWRNGHMVKLPNGHMLRDGLHLAIWPFGHLAICTHLPHADTRRSFHARLHPSS